MNARDRTMLERSARIGLRHQLGLCVPEDWEEDPIKRKIQEETERQTILDCADAAARIADAMVAEARKRFGVRR